MKRVINKVSIQAWAILFSFAFIIPCFGQELPNLKFKKIGVSDGLSSTTVSSIIQDNKGFLWFGTRDGLNKFDGYTIKTYHNELYDDSTLHDNWVSSLYEDPSNKLWISTIKGLSLYDDDLDKIIRIKDENNILEGLTISQISAGHGNQILLSSRKGLFSFDSKDVQQQITLKQIVNTSVISAYADQDTLWIGSTDGVYCYDYRAKSISKVYNYDNNVVSYNFKIKFFRLNQDTLLMASPLGLFQWDGQKETFVPFIFKDSDGHIHSFPKAIRAIVKDSNDVLWIGAIDGLYLLNIAKKKFSKYSHIPQDLYSLSHNSIYDILEDEDHNMWIGTWAGGVNLFDRSLGTFNHYYSSETEDALSNNIISSFVEDEPNRFWIGTEGGGLNYFDRLSGKFERIHYSPTDEPDANIKKIIKDQNGNLWIGLHYHGLEVYNPKQKNYTKYKHHHADRHSLSNSTIMTLYEDSQSNIWIGTNGGGLNRYMGNGQFERYDNQSWTSNMTVFSIHEKWNGSLMLGTNRGLVEFTPDNKQFTPSNIFSEALDEDITVHTIYSEKDSVYWLGTSSHGLIKFNSVNDDVKVYHTANGLPNNLVYGILPGGHHTLWISTNNGLSTFNIDTETFTNYSIKNGLQSSVFNYNSFLKTSQGDMLFGGINGFNLFDPSKISTKERNAPLYITSIKVFDKEVQGDNEMVKNITNSEKVILEPDQFNFTISYTSINFVSPQSTKYLYKLEGVDNDWVVAGNQRFANYNDIGPGTYTFKVKTYSNTDNPQVSQASLEIIVLAPWWQTRWAYLGYFLLFAILLFSLWKFRSWQFRLRQKLLQSQMDTENEKILYDLKLNFFTNISHELKTPLTLILGPAEELISHEWKSNTLKEKAHLLYSQSKKMYQLVNQLLEFRKTETDNISLRALKGDVSNFVNEIYLVFKLKAQEKGIQYTFKSINHDISIYFDREKLEMVFTNLLSNAFKHTHEGGSIKVDVDFVGSPAKDAEFLQGALVNNYAKISIEDDGNGMSREEMDKIFDRFHQTFRSETLSISGTGIGLSLVKDFVSIHHGEVLVKSALKEGTIFTVKLPFGSKHLAPEQILPDINAGAEFTIYKDIDLEKDHDTRPIRNAEAFPFTILIVDDNEDLLSYLQGLLSPSYSILMAENGLEALETLKSHTPDLIISDVMMPEMDGITLCQKVNEDKSLGYIPFILLTARTATVYEIEGLTIGATDYISKPFNPKVLQAKIHNIFSNKLRLHEFYEKSILKEHFELEIPDEDREFIEHAIRLVEQNVEDLEFNVQVLARDMAMSQSSFYKKLKSITGKTAVEFIRDVRMRVAAQLLINSKYRISDISLKVGISDTKYFRESFKKIYGMSPSQYKTQKKQSNDS
ncbi:hybrid sensor histidine kinase/response regulator [Echinicola pacifica]|uniref:histidine kinase n=1 Tax=Echinicola pacifica TaxID=346377 RepID=A0A918PT18_9BACT|nr:hybrid sensor histidine kinase/response regulator transcription factor [Echinicola pacifica]GGZ21710.1 hybrid sensor histidine kinase/response regulator [Echinicola pacifica]